MMEDFPLLLPRSMATTLERCLRLAPASTPALESIPYIHLPPCFSQTSSHSPNQHKISTTTGILTMTSNFYLPDRVDVEGGIMLDRGPNGGVIYLGNNDKRSEAGDGSLEPGDLIFTILEPLICVAYLGTEGTRVCGTCFAGVFTFEYEKYTFEFFTHEWQMAEEESCDYCGMLFFCDDIQSRCLKDANHDHHNFECPFKLDGRTGYTALYRYNQVHIRALIRLIRLVDNGEISKHDWDEIQLLPISQNLATLSEDLKASVASGVKAIKFLTRTRLGEDIITDLFYKVCTHLFDMDGHLLKSGCHPVYTLGLKHSYYAGSCLEPFISGFHYSCKPNTVILFEGKVLEVRAIRRIAPGDEIFIHYTRQSNIIYTRPDPSVESWGAKCVCKNPSCKSLTSLAGTSFPISLLQKASRMPVSLAEVQAMMLQMERDQPHNLYPLFDILRLQTLAGSSDDRLVLWTLLTMVYKVGPAQADYVSPYEMLDTQRTLFYHMLAMYNDQKPKPSQIPDLPDGMPANFLLPVLHLAYSYWDEVIKWRGEYSEMIYHLKFEFTGLQGLAREVYDLDIKQFPKDEDWEMVNDVLKSEANCKEVSNIMKRLVDWTTEVSERE